MSKQEPVKTTLEEAQEVQPDAWGKLAEVAAQQPEPSAPPRWKQWWFVVQDWLAAPVPLGLTLIIAVFIFVLGAAAMAFVARPAAAPVQAMAFPTATQKPMTPTPTTTEAAMTVAPLPVAHAAATAVATPLPTDEPTQAPTPTALPTPTATAVAYFVVWTPNAEGAFVRAKPSAVAQQLDVVPNGVQVIWTGNRKENQGFVWYEVQYPTKDSMNVGWMANIVLYDIQPVGCLQRQTGFYVDADGAPGAFLRWLPAGTPLVEVNANGQWALVRLPDDSEGWVKAEAIANTAPQFAP